MLRSQFNIDPLQRSISSKPHLLFVLVCFFISPSIFAETTISPMEMRAQLAPINFTTLSSEFDAKIEHISVREGDAFKAKQILIRFDCRLQSAQLKKARAAQAGAQNTLAGNQRLAKLGAIGQVELKNSKVEVQKAQADVSYLQTTLSKCKVEAPFSGRVEAVNAQSNQYVTAGQPLLDIIDDSALELVFIMPSRWLAWLKKDYPLQIQIEETGKSYPARLTRTSARVDPVSQSVKAFAIIEGYFPELMSGMSGRVDISPPQPALQ